MSEKISRSPEDLTKKIEELSKVLSAFYALTEAVNQSLNLQETLKISLESVKEVFKADAAHIRLLDEETHELVLTVHQGLSPAELKRIVSRRKFGEGSCWRCVQSGKPLIQNPLKTSTILNSGGLQVSVTIPLKSKGKIIGTMALHQQTRRTFFKEEIELMGHIGDQIGVAVENARLFSQLQQRTEALSALNKITQAVNRSLHLDSILNDAIEKAVELLQVDGGFLRLLSDDKQELVLNAYKGFTDEQIGKLTFSRKYGEGSSWKALLQDQVYQLEFNSNNLEQRQTHSFGLLIGARSAIFFPLKSKDNFVGAMSLYSFQHRKFTKQEIDLSATIGNQIGVAIENARLHSRLLESEKKYKALFETSGEALFVLDLEGNFNLINHPVEQITGYTRAELLGKHFSTLVSPQDLEFISGVFDSGFENCSKMSFEIRMIDKMGDEHIIEILEGASPVEASGKITGYLVTARDLTEKKKSEEKLLQTAKLQSLGEMASGIAHDFNNILMVILGHTELLLRDTTDASLIKKLKIIERASLDGSETVRKIGDFTRTTPKEAELEPLELHKVIQNALEFTSSRWKDVYQKEGYPFELKLNLNEIPLLPGIESELREAFVNIILNSLDAMPHGGILGIESELLEKLPEYQNEHKIDPSGFVRIKISDTGIGMDEQTCKKIFDPFFSTKGVKGLGLGLSIAYGIIKRHHGDMKVESRKGIGTTFIIHLPIRKAAPKAPKPSDALPPRKQAARILVVDDEPDNLDFLSELLERLGHHVATATNGEAALAKFKTEGPWDMVFTDLGMPGISGWDLVRELKALNPGLPTILITGWGFQLQEEETKAKKVDYVLSKPVKIKDVTQMINRILARQAES
ncbi:MAG: GAF domain-containing protein [Thermodesulfobacteriota bacterium]